MRTPDEFMADYDAGCRGVKDIDMNELLWEIIDDVRDSYRLAMHNAGVNTATASVVTTTVSDYLANHYSDERSSS